MKTVTINIDGLKKYFTEFGENVDSQMSMSLNRVIGRDGIGSVKKEIYKQVAYPNGYIDSDKLYVSRKASPGELSVVMTAQDRPTSLARFASQKDVKASRGKPLNVTVKPGSTQTLDKAFLLNLKGNNGLAIRVKGGRPTNSRSAKQMSSKNPNVYLLYGPSVEQTMISVATDKADFMLSKVALEFFRLMEKK